MFTQQVQQLGAALQMVGMPPEQALMFMQVLGGCAQPLATNGPVTIQTSLPSTNVGTNPATSVSGTAPSGGSSIEAALLVANFSNPVANSGVPPNPNGPFAINVPNGVFLGPAPNLGVMIIPNLMMPPDGKWLIDGNTMASGLKQLPGYDASAQQVIYNNAGTVSWKTLTATTVVLSVDWNVHGTNVLSKDTQQLWAIPDGSSTVGTVIDTADVC